jgi:hypothetical protein
MTAVPRWVRDLRFSRANTAHIARHGVRREEVEEACYGDSFARRAGRNLYRVTGQTLSGRWLTVFLSPRGGGAYYVVTARDATDNERRGARRS